MDVLLVVCGYSPIENHPTAHTPPQPRSAVAEPLSFPVAVGDNGLNKLGGMSEEKHKLRRRKGGDDAAEDENYKSSAQQ